ncbi:MAG: hypothetical protein ACOCWL_03400 [Thermoguttaceae bacterium]
MSDPTAHIKLTRRFGTALRSGLVGRRMGIAGLLLATGQACAAGFTIERLNDGRPIVSQQSFLDAGSDFAAQGENINGPSMIRVPDWIPPADRPHPDARYYLYFADHNGAFIRMGWAARIDGPYTLFGQYLLAEGKPRGVLDLGRERRKPLDNGLELRGHVASPDVHVNDRLRRIEMVFHAPAYHDGSAIGQKSFAAVSRNGLDFNGGIAPVALGFAYFRVFAWGGEWYAVASRGALYKARDPADPFTPPAGFDFSQELWLPQGKTPSDNPFQRAIDAARAAGRLPAAVERARHFAVEATGADGLRFLYTRVGDAPERIVASTLSQPPADLAQWKPSFPPQGTGPGRLSRFSRRPGHVAQSASNYRRENGTVPFACSGEDGPRRRALTTDAPQEWLRPELPWEGAEEPNVPSRAGAARGLVHQLRDPFLFRDADGRRYLLYSGGGEQGIGIALVKMEPVHGDCPLRIQRRRLPAPPRERLLKMEPECLSGDIDHDR